MARLATCESGQYEPGSDEAEDGLVTILAGSREGVTMDDVTDAVTRCGWEIRRVVSGTARGADQLGERWAAANHILVDRYPADWDAHGKSAGYRRNEQMAANADALIALWANESRGTKHMIDIATKRGLRVFVKKCSGVADEYNPREQVTTE